MTTINKAAKQQKTKIIKVNVRTLRDGSHKMAGSFDNASRWEADDEYCVPGSFNVRSPSRAWPFSHLKHFYSIKYAKMLIRERADLYMSLQNISKDSDEGKHIIAAAAAAKMGGRVKYVVSHELSDDEKINNVVAQSDYRARYDAFRAEKERSVEENRVYLLKIYDEKTKEIREQIAEAQIEKDTTDTCYNEYLTSKNYLYTDASQVFQYLRENAQAAAAILFPSPQGE